MKAPVLSRNGNMGEPVLEQKIAKLLESELAQMMGIGAVAQLGVWRGENQAPARRDDAGYLRHKARRIR
jgi:hypothetical protein